MRDTVHHAGGGRRALHALAQARHPHGRAAIWQALLRVRGGTVAEVAKAAAADHRTVRRYLLALREAGFVRLDLGLGPEDAARFWLREDVKLPKAPPRVRADGVATTAGDAQDRLWRTMKMLRGFTVEELAIGASIEGRPVSRATAGAYTNELYYAGYLGLVHPARPGQFPVPARFRLAKNTGPEAPRVQRGHVVFDPNTGLRMPRLERPSARVAGRAAR